MSFLRICGCWNGGLCPAHKLEVLERKFKLKFSRATH